MTWYRDWFGEEYLELYSHRDEEEARAQVDFFCSAVGDGGGTVLDLACGSGRHLQELTARGVRAVGVDLSLLLLRVGVVQYTLNGLVRADMQHLPFRRASFSALVNFFTSFGYFATEHEDRLAVAEMARVLRPRARLLFDYLNVPLEIARLVSHETKVTDAGRAVIERWFDPPTKTFHKQITIGGRVFIERVRAWDFESIRELFNACGLEAEALYGDFDGKAYSKESPRLIVVGRRSD